MRNYEFALDKNGNKQYADAKIPEYQTQFSAGADFFAAEDTVIPSILNSGKITPVLVHTGIKACMEDDEVLYLFNRSSNPGKKGLILANGVGVVDKDYYGNPDNDGEIMFAFYNVGPASIIIASGERIGQGVFEKILHPQNANIKNVKRKSGWGSSDKDMSI